MQFDCGRRGCDWSVRREAHGLRRVVQQLSRKGNVGGERFGFYVGGATTVVSHMRVSNRQSDSVVRPAQIGVGVSEYLRNVRINRLLDQQAVVLLSHFVRGAVKRRGPVSNSREMLTSTG
jgi:hypothetical protein